MADEDSIKEAQRIVPLHGIGSSNVYPKSLVNRKLKHQHKEQPPRKQDKSKKEGVDIEA
jgi:hypothetical protein